MNYLSEAFKKLDVLDEDVFDVDAQGIRDFEEFRDNDDTEDIVTVVDPEADTEEDLSDSYIGKVILDCSVCHTDIYKSKDDVTIDEEQGLANVGEECPYCFSIDGFKVIGEVKPYSETEVETEDDIEVEVDGEEVPVNESFQDESFSNGNAEGGFLDTAKRPGGSVKGSGTNHKALDGKKTKTVKAKDLKPGMITDTGKILKVTNVGWINGRPSVEVSYGGIGNRGSYASDTVAADRDYEVLDESLENVKLDTGDQEIEITARDKEPTMGGDEMIAPVSAELESEIASNDPEDEEADDVDVDLDDFSEEEFDGLGESYLKKVYNNVDSYKTVRASSSGNTLKLEGLIKFNSGKTKKTSFVFESSTITKSGKAKFVGENTQISRGKKSFTLTGSLKNNKFIAESLNYNYRAKDAGSGKSTRIYGTVTNKK